MQGAPSALRPTFYCPRFSYSVSVWLPQPNSAWASANLAELAWQPGSVSEHSTVVSTKNSLRADGAPCSGRPNPKTYNNWVSIPSYDPDENNVMGSPSYLLHVPDRILRVLPATTTIWTKSKSNVIPFMSDWRDSGPFGDWGARWKI